MASAQPTFYLDTNAYRRLARENKPIPAGIKKIALSFITSIELIEQLQRSSGQHFEETRRAVFLACKHGRKKFLPGPMDFVQWKLFAQAPDTKYLRHCKKGIEVALRVTRKDRIKSPVRIAGKMYKLSDFVGPRKNSQHQWVSQIKRFRDMALQHQDLSQPTGRDLIAGENAKILTDLVRSTQWRESYARFVIPESHSNSSEIDFVTKIANALDAAATFLGDIVRAALIDGYRFENKANDSYDHLQLQYLCVDEMIFVTDDAALVQRVAMSAQRSRVISLGHFVQGSW